MVVSYSTKKIALGPKEYLQSNTRAENLIEAYGRNCTTCSYKVHVMIQNIMMIESRKNMVDPYASIWAYKALHSPLLSPRVTAALAGPK